MSEAQIREVSELIQDRICTLILEAERTQTAIVNIDKAVADELRRYLARVRGAAL